MITSEKVSRKLKDRKFAPPSPMTWVYVNPHRPEVIAVPVLEAKAGGYEILCPAYTLRDLLKLLSKAKSKTEKHPLHFAINNLTIHSLEVRGWWESEKSDARRQFIRDPKIEGNELEDTLGNLLIEWHDAVIAGR